MKDFLICIDSDGCAIDSMEVKHRKCFGPCMIETWHLESHQAEILNRWNTINLYSETRGINRFLGLEMMLSAIDGKYVQIDGLQAYQSWCKETNAFSNDAVRAQIDKNEEPIFKKVLLWSETVNRRIESIQAEIHPFDGVKKTLEQMHKYADIAIVSSANPQAVRDEWTRFGLMPYVDFVMAQDAGTKSACIHRMLQTGYLPSRTMMIGDAPGDACAAAENGVWFYPILAGKETDSWNCLQAEMQNIFLQNQFNETYQQALLDSFYSNLTK